MVGGTAEPPAYTVGDAGDVCTHRVTHGAIEVRLERRVPGSLDEIGEPAEQQLEELRRGGDDAPVARKPFRPGEGDLPRVPATADQLLEDHVVVALERIRPGGQRRAGNPPELCVAVAEQAARILVEAEEQMEAMLLDAIGLRGVAATRPLPSEPPAHLVDDHVERVPPPVGIGELERCRKRGHPAAQDDDTPFLGSARGDAHRSLQGTLVCKHQAPRSVRAPWKEGAVPST